MTVWLEAVGGALTTEHIFGKPLLFVGDIAHGPHSLLTHDGKGKPLPKPMYAHELVRLVLEGGDISPDEFAACCAFLGS